MITKPLWHDGLDDEFWNHGHDLWQHLQSVDSENWWVWTQWYERILQGAVHNEQLEIKKALIPNMDWARGPAHVNALIAEMIERHRPKQTESEKEPSGSIPEQSNHGARWTFSGDRIVIAPGLPDIGDKAEALQPLAVNALEELIEALGQSNQFKRLSDKAGKTLEVARKDLTEANKQAAALWTCSVWMGDFAERDDAVRANPKAFADALEEDQRLALNAAVRQTAAFARQFRTALEMDAEDAAFRRAEFRIEPHRQIVDVDHEEDLIDDESHETASTMVEAAEGDAIQGDKAKSTLVATVRNFLIATVVIMSPAGTAVDEAAKVLGKEGGTGFAEGVKFQDRMRRLGERSGDAIDDVLNAAPADIRQGLAPLRATLPPKKP
ncbi:MAG: hypothetical protein AAGH68_05500 [Pseudomonadota bacterium]